MQAVDSQQASSGWILRGAWTPNVNAAPLGVSAGAAKTGTNPTSALFTAIYSDDNGSSDLKTLNFMLTAGGADIDLGCLRYAAIGSETGRVEVWRKHSEMECGGEAWGDRRHAERPHVCATRV